jgi:hypothetical protein
MHRKLNLPDLFLVISLAMIAPEAAYRMTLNTVGSTRSTKKRVPTGTRAQMITAAKPAR